MRLLTGPILLLALAVTGCFAELIPTGHSKECSAAAEHVHACCPNLPTAIVECSDHELGRHQSHADFSTAQGLCVSAMTCPAVATAITSRGSSSDCGVDWSKFRFVKCEDNRPRFQPAE